METQLKHLLDDYVTIRHLQRLTGKPRHVLNYAIDLYGPPPRKRLGITRIWHKEDVPAVRAALAKTCRRQQELAAV